MSTTITVIGNLVEDQIRLNHTSDGTPAANLTIADNTRFYDDRAGQWKQAGEATYWNIEVFGEQAERVAEQAHKGQRLIIVGRTKTSTWTDQEGTKRRELPISADDIAPWASEIDRRLRGIIDGSTIGVPESEVRQHFSL